MVTEKIIKELVKGKTDNLLSEHIYKSVSKTIYYYFISEQKKEKERVRKKKLQNLNEDIVSFLGDIMYYNEIPKKIYIKDIRNDFALVHYEMTPTSFSKQLFKVLRAKEINYKRYVDEKGRYFVI